MEYENFSFPEALKYLAERAGMELPEEELNEEAKRAMDEKARLREMNKLSANYFYYLLHSKRGQKGLAYLKTVGSQMLRSNILVLDMLIFIMMTCIDF